MCEKRAAMQNCKRADDKKWRLWFWLDLRISRLLWIKCPQRPQSGSQPLKPLSRTHKGALHGISGFQGTLACSAPLNRTHKGALHGISGFQGTLACSASLSRTHKGALHGISGFQGTLACSTSLSRTHKGALHGISCFWGSLAYRYFVHTNRCNGSSGTWGCYFKCTGSSHTLGYYLHWLTTADMSPIMPKTCKTTTNDKVKEATHYFLLPPEAVLNKGLLLLSKFLKACAWRTMWAKTSLQCCTWT